MARESVQSERLRIPDLVGQHAALAIGIPMAKRQLLLTFFATSFHALTCEGDCRAVSRSCCSVRSRVLCFWKFCSAFDGPQRPSAMICRYC